MNLFENIYKHIEIHAPASKIWNAITKPELITRWLSETNMEVVCECKVGGEMSIKGDLHGNYFENKGTILQFEPNSVFQYNYFSNISQLPNKPESYTALEFKLTELETATLLSLTISNFPTESIYRHCDFYWNVTLNVIKELVEN